jgi:LPS-assembly protein
MNNVYKGKAKYVLALVLLLLLITGVQAGGGNRFFIDSYNSINDSLPPVSSITTLSDSVQRTIVTDSSNKNFSLNKNLTDTSIPTKKVDTLNIKVSKDSLDAPVVYHADDSMVMDVPAEKIFLYGKESKTTYNHNELTAPGIEFDQKSNFVIASLKKDSTGKVIAYPTFVQADFKSVSDTIKFNMKTGKGFTSGSYIQQGEIYIYGEKTKKISPDVFYAYRGRFTTCDLDTPHFAFVSNKIKFINKKMAITGPVHPEFEGVPLPIYLPFGIFPLTQGRHSGILAPTFTSNEQLGLALEGLGYYKVLSDNFDVTLRGTLYSYGGWTMNVSPNYYKRYHYRGNFSLYLQRFHYNFKGDPDYSVSKSFKITWEHSMDSKARPGVSFSANVNAGSSSFNALVPNSPTTNFSNQLSSSIQFAKVWKDKPFNISINANHSQNTIDKSFNVTLPDVAFNVNTLYPFRRKEVVGNFKWYENIGIALNSDARSLTSFTDDSLTLRTLSIGKQISNNFQWGASHTVPISLSLPALGPIQVSPSVSYAERWYQEKIVQNWSYLDKKIDTTIQKGFYSARNMSFGVGIATRIFGSFTFGKNSSIIAIRHEIRPSISISYSPDLNSQYYYNSQVDSAGQIERYSVFNGSMYGAFSEGRFGGMSFSIDNNLQMKVRNRKDTGDNAIKKISLLDGFSLSGNYNFLADSFQLSTFSVNAHSDLFNKINITASASIDPYQTDAHGNRINKLVWDQKLLTLGRLTSGSVSLSSQFKGGDKKNSNNNSSQNLIGQPYNAATGMPLDEYQTELAYINNNPAQFTDFTIPWSVSFSYSLQFSKIINSTFSGFTTQFNQNVNWNGTLGLSPKWQMGLNGYYNITTSDLGTLSISLAREMHCWQMAINISPVGHYRFFNITLNPKSGLLKDLRINRSRNFYDLP